MGEILSEQEMSALLAETRAGAGASPSAGPGVAAFSFTAPIPFAPDALDRLGALGSRFAETLRSRLTAELRREVAAAVSPVEVLSDANAEQLFSGSVHLCFETQEGRRAADLVFETELALALVEARLGGRIAEPQPRRPLTPVEMTLLARLMGICGIPALEASFGTGARQDAGDSAGGAAGNSGAHTKGAAAGGTGTGAAAETIECVPGTLEQGAGGGFVSIPLQLSIEERGGIATVLLPAARGAALSAAPAAASRAHKPGRHIAAGTIAKLPVRVVPRIPGGTITLRDLMALEPGLVVRLDQREDEPIEILTNGEPALTGRLIRAGTATAIEIAAWAEEKGADEESQ